MQSLRLLLLLVDVLALAPELRSQPTGSRAAHPHIKRQVAESKQMKKSPFRAVPETFPVHRCRARLPSPPRLLRHLILLRLLKNQTPILRPWTLSTVMSPPIRISRRARASPQRDHAFLKRLRMLGLSLRVKSVTSPIGGVQSPFQLNNLRSHLRLRLKIRGALLLLAIASFRSQIPVREISPFVVEDLTFLPSTQLFVLTFRNFFVF